MAKPDFFQRPCCPSKVSVALFFEGSTYFGHKPSCKYYTVRKKRASGE